MSKILAIETSTAACSVAVDVNGNLFERHQIAPREHGNLLLPWIKSLLEEANLTVADLDAIAFGCGPGGFTGVRVGCGIVQGLALGADIGVVPVSSLQALAQQAYDDYQVAHSVVIQDAKMGEVYWGAYQLDSNEIMRPVLPDQLSKIEEIQMPTDVSLVKIGDVTDFEPCYPSAKAVLKIAQYKLKSEQPIDVSEALPVYLRGESAWKKK